MLDRSIGLTLSIACLAFSAASDLLHADDERKKEISPEANKALDRMIERIKQLHSYADQAVVESKAPMGFKEEAQPAAFVFEKPERFRIATESHEICSDGKELTVHSRKMKRYQVSSLGKDWAQKIEHYRFAPSPGLHVSKLFFEKDPKKSLTDMVKNLDVNGEETVGGERCIVLSGVGARNPDFESDRGPEMDIQTEVRFYLRKSDGLLRRVEQIQKVKFTQPETEEDEDESDDSSGNPFFNFFSGDGLTTTHTYDLLNIHTDERPSEEAFVFKPPQGVKKVDRFFAEWDQVESQASQFDLSGHPAPDFELPTLDGKSFALGDTKEQVVVLVFGSIPGDELSEKQIGNLKKLDQVDDEFPNGEVRVVYVVSKAPEEEFKAAVEKAGIGLTFALDEDQGVQFAYFEDDSTHAKVLVDKKGIVQGRYSSSVEDSALTALKSDLQKLVKGETLPSGEPMSDEEIAEMAAQRMLRWSENAEEPINEGDLHLAWTVRARDDDQFGMPMRDRPVPAARLWIADKDVVRLIAPDGESIAEFKLPEKSSDKMSFSQDDFIIGKFGNNYGLVHVKDLAPINFTSFGGGMKKREKGFEMKLIAEGGKDVWSIELPPTQFQGPGDLQAADCNGDRIDEVVFTHADSLWMVSGRGEVIVRKPFRSFGGWVRALDLDKDGKCELYLLCDGRLQRFDYKPR